MNGLSKSTKTVEPALDRRELGGQLQPPGLVALLHAQRVEGVEADIGDAAILARFHHGVVERRHAIHRMVQLPTELARIGHPERAQRHPRDLDLAGRQPGERAAAEIGVGQAREQVARAGAGDQQNAVIVGHVGDFDVLVRAPVLRQPVEVVDPGDGGGQEIEPVGAQPRGGELALDAAEPRERVGERDPALARHAVGEDAIEERSRVGAGHVELRERREVEHADPLAHRAAFLAHRVEPVHAAEAVALLDARRREPLGPFPAEGFGEHGAAVREPAVDRRGPDRPSGLAVLAGIMDLVHLVVFVDRLFDAVSAHSPVAEPPRLHFTHVDLGLAVHHPLREILARARTLGDADPGAAAHPEIVESGRRPDQEPAVRGVGDRPADHPPDARVLEHRDAPCGALEPRDQPVDVGRQQLGVERPVDPVERPGLGVVGLVGADDQPVLLLAVVAGGVRVADHRRLPLQRGDLGEVLGHQILVDHVDDGNLEPDHRAHLRREPARGVDHVLGDDRAPLGHHVPVAAGSPGDVDDPVAELDPGTAPARDRGHRHGPAGGIGVPVARRVGAQQHAFGVEQRVQPGDLVGADQVALRADAAQHALHVAEPVDLIFVGREPDRAAAMPARGLTRFGLQALVKPGGVEMRLRHVEAADEVRDQPGRVPGRARGELALLDQHDIGPPLLDEVVKERDPHHAAADHDDARVRFHRRPPGGGSAGFTNGIALDIATPPAPRRRRIGRIRPYRLFGAAASGFSRGYTSSGASEPSTEDDATSESGLTGEFPQPGASSPPLFRSRCRNRRTVLRYGEDLAEALERVAQAKKTPT